jgi:CRP/FNR family cyclic AMP-dependent transcriptional regulator
MFASAGSEGWEGPIGVPVVGSNSLEALSELGTRCRVRAQAELFCRGDAGTDVFRVVRGHAKVSVRSCDGRDLTFCVMGPGEFFGEIAAFGGGLRTASVTALDDSEFLRVHKSDLLRVLERDPALALTFFGLIAGRLRQTSRVRERLSFCGMPSQLAEVLLRLADRFGVSAGSDDLRCGSEASEAVRIDLRMSQRELGSLVGTSRVSANRQLCRWRAAGIIGDERGCIVIVEPHALERIAAGARTTGRTMH